MARRDVDADEERRSYGAVFLVAVGLLLAGAVWSVWDDNITRRPWKYHQLKFSDLELQRAQSLLDEEEARLEANDEYVKLSTELANARARLENGKTGERIRDLEAQLEEAQTRHFEFDLELRIQKSRLEEAWYAYEHAQHTGHPGDEERRYIEALEKEKAPIDKGFADTKARVEQIEKELTETRAEVNTLENKLRDFTVMRDRHMQKLNALATSFGPVSVPPVPKIHQVVLEEFERNNYDKPLARVDRCTSCHAGINKDGFEDAPQPYTTHPRRKEILGHHPPERLACTPCHEGQGPAINSPEEAHGEVRFWTEPLMRDEKVEASCIRCHLTVRNLPGAEFIAKGESLFEELGCHGCHLVQGYEDLQKAGPYLRRVAAKVEPAWAVRWITNPHEFRPQTRMPNFLFERDQSVSIAAYVLNASQPESEQWLANRPAPEGIDPNNPELVAEGQQLFETLGCRGCHAVEPGEAPTLLGEDKHVAPNLANIAEKTDARWMFYWLKNPREYAPQARMPDLRLSDDEARSLVSFLLTLGEAKPEPALAERLRDPQEIAKGEKLVRKYGCNGCHAIPGMENEARIGVELTTFASKPLEELFFGDRIDIPHTWDDWTFNKLKAPRTYATERIEQLMPQFNLADSDAHALSVFLASRRSARIPEDYRAGIGKNAKEIRDGQRVVARYNCTGCHVIEGKGGAIRARYEESPALAPPILNGEGAKVQPAWLFKFLKQPMPLRPWLKVRMPTFHLSDRETKTLVEYFAAVDNVDVPFVHIDESRIDREHLRAGKVLMSDDYFACFSCHQRGDRSPEGPPEGWAPDLAMARERLNPDWIADWLRNPQAVMPGTKMPAFYEAAEDGTAMGGPDDILDGDNERQLRALRDYIMVLQDADRLLAETHSNGSQLASVEDSAPEEMEPAPEI